MDGPCVTEFVIGVVVVLMLVSGAVHCYQLNTEQEQVTFSEDIGVGTDADLCLTNYYPQTVFKNREGCLKWLSTICRHPDDRCIVSEILTPADIKKEIRE